MRLAFAAALVCLLCVPASAEKRLRCPKGFHAVASAGPTLKLPKAESERGGRRGRRAKGQQGEDGPPLVRSRRGKEESEEAPASSGQRCVADAPSAKRDEAEEQTALDPIPALEKDAGAAVPQLPLPPP